MLPLLLALVAAADDEPDLTAELHGDIKTFGVAVFPYDHILMGTTWEPQCAGPVGSSAASDDSARPVPFPIRTTSRSRRPPRAVRACGTSG